MANKPQADRDASRPAPVEITQADLTNGRYTFAEGVVYSKQIGVSQSAQSKGEKSESQVNLTVDLSGLPLAILLNDADYKYGVNARASFRSHGWIPEAGTRVTVRASDGGRVKLESLPPEVQALAIFAKIEDVETRQKAIRAFLSTQ